MLRRGELTPSQWVDARREAGELRWDDFAGAPLSLKHASEVRSFYAEHSRDGEPRSVEMRRYGRQNETRLVFPDGASTIPSPPSGSLGFLAAGDVGSGEYWRASEHAVARLTLRILRVNAILAGLAADYDALLMTGDAEAIDRLIAQTEPYKQELRLLEAGFDAQPRIKEILAEEQRQAEEQLRIDAATQRHEMATRRRLADVTRKGAATFGDVKRRKPPAERPVTIR